MKLSAIAVLAVAPVVFGQAHRAVPPPRPTPPPAPPARPGPIPPAGVRYGFAGGYPVYVLGYYPNPFYYDSSYAVPAPSTDVPPAQPLPDVIVNPNFKPDTTNPTMHVYSYTPDAQSSDQNAAPAPPQVYFLIAMRDHTIVAALAYWVENGRLNYINQQGVRYQVALDAVDRDFSSQLNRERNVDFALPAANQS